MKIIYSPFFAFQFTGEIKIAIVYEIKTEFKNNGLADSVITDAVLDTTLDNSCSSLRE